MIKSIQRFFDTYLTPAGPDQHEQMPSERIRLAVAALLVEIAESDFSRSHDEKQVILDIVRADFSLSAEQAELLFSLAESEHAESTDYFQFTRLINQHYSAEEKVGLIEALWRVAFADQVLHHYEEHVIRRLADLLHVSHRDFIAAKHRVMQTDRP